MPKEQAEAMLRKVRERELDHKKKKQEEHERDAWGRCRAWRKELVNERRRTFSNRACGAAWRRRL